MIQIKNFKELYTELDKIYDLWGGELKNNKEALFFVCEGVEIRVLKIVEKTKHFVDEKSKGITKKDKYTVCVMNKKGEEESTLAIYYNPQSIYNCTKNINNFCKNYKNKEKL